MSIVDDIMGFEVICPTTDNIWLDDEERSHLWSELGQGLRETGDIEGAIEALQQATQYKFDNSLAWYRLALTYRMQGDLSETGMALRKVRWESFSKGIAEFEQEVYGV
ncbi:MAG: tetratricopeptide repeat protein [Candidatus Thorarchaeota archaeon]